MSMLVTDLGCLVKPFWEKLLAVESSMRSQKSREVVRTQDHMKIIGRVRIRASALS